MDKKLIIIPDVHGREFWKDALSYINDGTPVVFLGDYLDPYSHEGITPVMALDNFREILEVTNNKSNVTLLFGNHDCTYLFPFERICECRTDYENFGDISNLFAKNKKRFHLYHEFKLDNCEQKFLFTHAGVHPLWMKNFIEKEDETVETFIKRLDNGVQTDNHRCISSLAAVSFYRGGWGSFGSCVWADIDEFNIDFSESVLKGYTQVVGHTMRVKTEKTDGGFKWVPGDPLRIGFNGTVVCIDCQRCFYIDGEGDIRCLSNDAVI